MEAENRYGLEASGRADSLNKVKSKTNWKIEEYSDSFTIYGHDGYDIKWHNLPIYRTEISFGSYFKWLYSIDLEKTDYSQSEVEAYANQFIKELADEGFSVESKPKYPISKKMNKGIYNLELSLIIGNSSYCINVHVYPSR